MAAAAAALPWEGVAVEDGPMLLAKATRKSCPSFSNAVPLVNSNALAASST